MFQILYAYIILTAISISGVKYVNPNENQSEVPENQPINPAPSSPEQEPQAPIAPPNVKPAPVEPAPALDAQLSPALPQASQPEQPGFAPVAPVQPANMPAQGSSSKGLAVSALVLSIVGFLTGVFGIGILLGLIAVILGIIALIKHSAGKGMAIAGIIIGAITLVFAPILISITLASINGIQDKALQSLCDAQLRDGKTLDARCN